MWSQYVPRLNKVLHPQLVSGDMCQKGHSCLCIAASVLLGGFGVGTTVPPSAPSKRGKRKEELALIAYPRLTGSEVD